MSTRERQVVWISPSTWVNELTVVDIHQHGDHLYGYCKIGDITWLVQQNNPTLPVWIIVGWVRTD